MIHFLQGNYLLRIPEPSQIAPPAVDVQAKGSMKYMSQPNSSTAFFFNIKALKFLPLRKALSTVGEIVHPPGKTQLRLWLLNFSEMLSDFFTQT